MKHQADIGEKAPQQAPKQQYKRPESMDFSKTKELQNAQSSRKSWKPKS